MNVWVWVSAISLELNAIAPKKLQSPMASALADVWREVHIISTALF